MKLICATLLCLLCFDAAARLNTMRTLFLSEAAYADDGDEEAFEMNSELGVMFAEGNTNGTTITSKLNAKHNTQYWSTRYAANLLYKKNVQEIEGQKQSIASAQKVFVSAQTDYKLDDPTNRFFVYGEYEDDRFNSYRYQAALAVGWTEQLWSTPTSEFRYSIGPGYAVSRLKPEQIGADQVGVILRAAMEYEKKLNDTATFRQYVSTEADEEFARSVSETSLAAKINGSLAMKLSLNMTHNRSPGQIDESLDTQTSVTLVYQFF